MPTVRISIDDVTPHPHATTACLDHFRYLADHLKEGTPKITLFVPGAYWRTYRASTDRPLLLREHPKFVAELFDLVENFNYELGFHGYYHGIQGQSDNDEVRWMKYPEALHRFSLMRDEVDATGLPFRNIFRPPAWWMSREAMLAAKDFGFTKLCLNGEARYREHYGDGPEEADLKVDWATHYPPFKPLEYDGRDMSIVYHACDWDKNFLTVEKIKELTGFLNGVTMLEYKFCSED